MERLTFEGNFCDIAQCTGAPGGPFCEDGACSLKETWERLKAIEDILGNEYELERLRELVEAEKDERLVALPCKVGDKIWVKDRAGVPREMRMEAPDIRCVCTDEDNLCMALCNRKPDGFCAYRLKNDSTDIGKTVFLTREEAEEALTDSKGGGKDHA